jgi:hypothetical protein
VGDLLGLPDWAGVGRRGELGGELMLGAAMAGGRERGGGSGGIGRARH